MTKQADLIAYLFDGQQPEAAGFLSSELGQWMLASSRFTAFVETYRDKIRKKIRVAREPDYVLDVRSELDVARRLLSDRRFSTAYEPYPSVKGRGPDFSVTYRVNLVFNIEVARMRLDGSAQESAARQIAGNGAALASEANRARDRILRILLDKLGQMQAGMANLLVIHTQPEIARAIDLDEMMQEIKRKVEGKDPAFYALSRYPSPAAFYKDFLHLSGLLLWAQGAAKLWVNKQARPGLDEKVLHLIHSLADEK